MAGKVLTGRRPQSPFHTGKFYQADHTKKTVSKVPCNRDLLSGVDYSSFSKPRKVLPYPANRQQDCWLAGNQVVM